MRVFRTITSITNITVLTLLAAIGVSVVLEKAFGGPPGDIFVTDKEAKEFAEKYKKKDETPDLPIKPDKLGSTEEFVPQTRVPKGPREFESIWFQAWLSSAEGGKDSIECATAADDCLESFKRRFRK